MPWAELLLLALNSGKQGVIAALVASPESAFGSWPAALALWGAVCEGRAVEHAQIKELIVWQEDGLAVAKEGKHPKGYAAAARRQHGGR